MIGPFCAGSWIGFCLKPGTDGFSESRNIRCWILSELEQESHQFGNDDLGGPKADFEVDLSLLVHGYAALSKRQISAHAVERIVGRFASLYADGRRVDAVNESIVFPDFLVDLVDRLVVVGFAREAFVIAGVRVKADGVIRDTLC